MCPNLFIVGILFGGVYYDTASPLCVGVCVWWSTEDVPVPSFGLILLLVDCDIIYIPLLNISPTLSLLTR